MVGNVVRVINSLFRWCWAWAVTKIRNFIHVKPNPREFYLFVKTIKHIKPILSGIRMKIVSKNNLTCPNLPNLIISFSILNKNISFLPLLPCHTFLIPDTWLDNRNIMIFCQNLLHLFKRESLLVNCECFKLLHVINIRPYCI